MAPIINYQNEGNSVDPPHLQCYGRVSPQDQGELFESEGPPISSHASIELSGTGLQNSKTYVFESSTTTSRACVETFSAVDGVEKLSTLVIDRDAHTTSFSTSGPMSSLNESNSASASRGIHGVGDEQLFPNLSFGQRARALSFDQSQKDYICHKVSVNHEQAESWETNTNQENFEEINEKMPKQNGLNFHFNHPNLDYESKSQLHSNLLNQELSSTPRSEATDLSLDVDAILRKYGIETRNYNPSMTRAHNDYGSNLENSATSSVNSYRSYSSCRFVSNTYDNSKEYKGSQINVSQNNESFTKPQEPNLKDIHEEGEKSLNDVLPNEISLETSSVQTDNDVRSIYIDASNKETLEDQQPCKTSISSSNVDAPLVQDYSKKNDIQRLEISTERASELVNRELSAANGSSVDVAVNNFSTGFSGHVYGGSYMRSMSSLPSNMDASPFGGSYLKHHLAMSNQVTGKDANADTPGVSSAEPFTKTGNKDYLFSGGTGRSRFGSFTDSLEFSLQKERYRLRDIDNRITISPRRVMSPYNYNYKPSNYRSIHASSNFPIMSSYRGSVSRFGSFLSNTNSYSSPKDIDNIRRAGSNVDTGQFNNNRGFTNRNNEYGSEVAERLGVQEAWTNETPGKQLRQKPSSARHHQISPQKENPKQEACRQGSVRSARSLASRNIIERNKLAVSQNAFSRRNRVTSSRSKNNGQRPKPAKAISPPAKGSNVTGESNYSGQIGDTKEIQSPLNTEKNNSKENLGVTDAGSDHETKPTNNTRLNEADAKCKGSNENQRAEVSNVGKDSSLPKKRRIDTLKYRPYVQKTKARKDKSPEMVVETQPIGEIPTSKSSSIASQSQASCDAGESNLSSDENQMNTYPKERIRKKPIRRCLSYQEASIRELVTATALASALIKLRRERFEKLQVSPKVQGQNERKKVSAKANASGNNMASTSIKTKQRVKKTSKKTTPATVRPSTAKAR